MATFTQQTFLGASIRYFSSTVGWGNQPSTLEVGLVEDPVNGDSFNPPDVGSPVYFDYSGWKFGGLLQGWNKQFGEGGNPVYTVQVQDPRSILEGVQLILNDYSSTTYNIPNLYNVYGFLESTYGFGGSFVNDTGMPWMLVRDAFATLQIATPIRLNNYSLRFFPFAGLDLLPSYYRVGGGSDSISVLEFIDEICSVICCDYFVEMINDSAWGNLINLHFVSRRVPARIGAIEDFVNNVEGARSKSQGYEFANLTTSKFVVGGKVLTMDFQEQAYTYNNRSAYPGTYYDDTIIPYWGYDAFDNLIIGNGDFASPSGTGKEYQFRIDGRPIYIQTGIPATINYVTDLAEMRFARQGQDAWEAFLWWKNDDPKSIHFGKASTFGLIEGINKGMKELIVAMKDEGDAKIADIKTKRASGVGSSEAGRFSSSIFENETKEQQITKIYEYINKYATEYYGRKFMVRIPFVMGKIEPETNNIVFSVDPVQDGYVAEEYWGQTSYIGYTPYNLEKFTNESNLISCYARFAAMQTFDTEGKQNVQCKYGISHLGPDEYILDQYPDVSAGKMRENLFVRCEVDPKLVFLDKRTLYSPRAVVTLSNPIADNDNNDLLMSNGLVSEIRAWLLEPGSRCTSSGVDEMLATFPTTQFGGEQGWFGKSSILHIPDLVALPLQSNILRYGPWYATAEPGKVEFVSQDDLVPWNYGGYNIMNLTGLSMVQDALASQPSQENGTIEFPGIPSVQIGHALNDSGPAVTDISVSIGQDGVTTTYRMNTWSWQFGRMGKYNIDRYRRIAEVQKEQRKAFRMFVGYRDPVRISANQVNLINHPRRRGHRSSPNWLAGDIMAAGSGNTLKVTTNVAAIAGYRSLTQITPDSYINKAGISLDGLFVPYTTSTNNNTHFPHFENPVELDGINSITLNPFGDGGISVAFPDTSGVPTNLVNEYNNYDGNVRAVGIKAPIVVGGWGYDTNENPVPSGGDGEFLANYKNRADQWKVGPLDIRWDNDRKVWNASGGASFYIGKLKADLENGDTGIAIQYNEYWQSIGTEFNVYNPHEVNLPSGLRVRWSKYNGWSRYLVEPWEWTECPPLET